MDKHTTVISSLRMYIDLTVLGTYHVCSYGVTVYGSYWLKLPSVVISMSDLAPGASLCSVANLFSYASLTYGRSIVHDQISPGHSRLHY